MTASVRKKILVLTFLISGLGLFSELIAYARGPFGSIVASYSELLGHLRSISLVPFTSNIFLHFNRDYNLMSNNLNVVFYFVMLVGAFLFWRYGEKETRLVRAAFALLLLFEVISIVATAANYYLFPQIRSGLHIAIYVPRFLFFTWAYYWVLRQLNGTRTLQITENENGEWDYVDASKWLRWFHLMADTIFCLIIFSSFIHLFAISWIEKLANRGEERFALYVLMFIWRSIYYIFFETLFGATPAKMLTETRVVRSLTRPLDSTSVIGRTFSRFVPFEGLSFLINKTGWHDSWSMTRVVNEERAGVNGGRYFWLVPIVILSGAVVYFLNEKYDDYQWYLKEKKRYEQEVAGLKLELNELSDQHILKLENARRPYEKKVYLKILKVSNDSVTAVTLRDENSDYNWLSVADAFITQEYWLKEISLSKKVLMNMVVEDYEAYKDGEDHSLMLESEEEKKDARTLLIDGTRFIIREAVRVGFPQIKSNGGGSLNQGFISLYFENCGWEGTISDIKNLEGEIQWDNESVQVPAHRNVRYADCTDFGLFGSNYKSNSKYVFQFTVTNADNNEQRYEVSGFNLNRTLKRIP